jgi:DNA polymerase-3 subunit beta
MKATLTKADLQKGIAHVQNVVPSRSALPIISNVLLNATKGKLKLSATDLRVGIECTIGAKVTSQGSLSVSATRLGEIVRELPEKDILIQITKEKMLALTCGKSFFKIMSLPGDEFPALPVVETETPVKLEQRLVREMFQKTSFAISSEQARYTLTGLLFDLDKGKLRVVATDGRRMSYAQRDVEVPKDYRSGVIIPDKMITEVLRLMKGDGDVVVEIGENQVCFTFDDIRLVSQLIEGNFPDYKAVIPKKHEREVVVDTFDFTMATRRASAVTSREFNSVKLHICKGLMILSAVTPDVGEAKDEIAVSYDGDDIDIVFNPDYLLDALGSIETDRTVLQLKDALSPGVLKPYESEDYVYVIMPIKV